jgi:hypothetical protein
MKPKLFIGSSVEGLSVAEAIERNLEHKFDVKLWSTGVFDIGDTTIDSLLEELDKNDFGIFIFSLEDVAKIRGVEYSVVRDNVLYELGLYTGKLGRYNSFIVKPSTSPKDLHLPTDLTGIYIGSYDTTKDSIDSAVSSFCGKIKSQVFNNKYVFNGKWNFVWQVTGSEKYPDPIVDEVEVFHYKNKIKFIHTIDENEKYVINGEFSNSCLTGTWHNTIGVGYNGVFQMRMSGKVNNFKGVWCGWSDGGEVNSGPCSLVRIVDKK